MGEARNALVVRAAEAVVAIGGEWGTLSEIALARKMGIEVATLGLPPARGLELPAMTDPVAAAEWATERIRLARETV
jgi:predicted Rossmann-fold nucleotide-binding protein